MGAVGWQLGDGFWFEVVVSPWPARRGRPVVLTFTNGPELEFIRCFAVGVPDLVPHPELPWAVALNRIAEVPLLPLGPTAAEVRLPDDREEVALAFEVGWERCGYAPSHDESWTCTPLHVRFAAPSALGSEPEPNEPEPELPF